MNVALIIFNRPDLTARVLAAIAAAKPERLFVIADGPRPNRPDDIKNCAAARAVIDRVDWDCDVQRNFSDINLGCGRRPASGITWVFEQVESAIILEDDCVPNRSFFRFCDELLQRYAEDERVAQICGNFHHFGERRGDESYFFSRYNVCAGGFATWRRAWRHFDLTVSTWPRLRHTPWLHYQTGENRAEEVWRRLFEAAYRAQGNADFWDYQWTYACWIQNGISAVPNAGLLSNVGFRPDGTHTKAPSRYANLPTAELAFPLTHPLHMIPDAAADRYFAEHVLASPTRQPLWARAGGGVRTYASRLKHAALGFGSLHLG